MRHGPSQRQSALLRLPCEIVLAISARLSIADKLILSLCCTALYHLLHQKLLQAFNSQRLQQTMSSRRAVLARLEQEVSATHYYCHFNCPKLHPFSALSLSNDESPMKTTETLKERRYQLHASTPLGHTVHGRSSIFNTITTASS